MAQGDVLTNESVYISLALRAEIIFYDNYLIHIHQQADNNFLEK